MKLRYIKKFFENIQDLYEELPQFEFHRLVGMDFFTENKEKFTDKEIEEIDKVVKSFGKGLYTRVKGDGLLIQEPYDNPEIIMVGGKKRIIGEDRFIMLSIFKLKDEWYYIYIQKKDRCIKCDTIEGVKQFLKNI